MTHGAVRGRDGSSVPASWFVILAVLTAELLAAAVLAGAVAQLYIDFECRDGAYRAEHSERCSGGFPYPLF